jgi:hypothetical protein
MSLLSGCARVIVDAVGVVEDGELFTFDNWVVMNNIDEYMTKNKTHIYITSELK